MGVYLHGMSNRIKRADSTHCFFHLVRFPNARRCNLSRDTVDCQINIPISIYSNLAFNNCEVLLGKNPTNSIVFSQGTRIGIYCFGLNSKLWKLLNTRGVVKQSGRDGSVLNRSSQWSFYANPHPIRRVTLKTRMFSRS